MKRRIMILGVIGLVAFLGLAGLSNYKPKIVKEGEILSVNDIQADPSAYKGTITITGVVAKKSLTNPKVFAIIDTSEAKSCKSTGCAKFYLPVSYEGAIPKEWDEVQITGAIVKSSFLASKVDILRHLTL